MTNERAKELFEKIFNEGIEAKSIPQDGDTIEDDCGERHIIDWCGNDIEGFYDDFKNDINIESIEDEETLEVEIRRFIDEYVLRNGIMFYDYDDDGGDGLCALGAWEIVEDDGEEDDEDEDDEYGWM